MNGTRQIRTKNDGWPKTTTQERMGKIGRGKGGDAQNVRVKDLHHVSNWMVEAAFCLFPVVVAASGLRSDDQRHRVRS